MHLLLVLAAVLNATALSTVEGSVTTGGYPLPGCTVRLESPAHEARILVSNADGRYRFRDVPAGAWSIRFELEGFLAEEQPLAVHDPVVSVPALELRSSVTEEMIIVTCGGRTCTDSTPEDRYDVPRCSDHETNNMLIEAAERGDRSALVLLREHYASEITLGERYRIGAALVRMHAEDARIWNELVAHAEIAVQFPQSGKTPSPEYMQWCIERGLDPDRYWAFASSALNAIASDSRSRELLRRAAASGNVPLVHSAIVGLTHQRDFDSLPLLDAAIAKAGAQQQFLAETLLGFDDERANAIVKKYSAPPEDDASNEPR